MKGRVLIVSLWQLSHELHTNISWCLLFLLHMFYKSDNFCYTIHPWYPCFFAVWYRKWKNQIMSRKAQFLGGPFNHYIVLLEDLFSDQILFRHQGLKEYWNHVQRNIFDRPTQRHIRPWHKFLAQKHLRKNVKTILAFKNWNSYLKNPNM